MIQVKICTSVGKIA